jgi:hypothetical protein
MRHNVAQGNAVFDHEVRGEARCAVHGGVEIATALLAHFDADAVAVPWTIKVCVFALLIGRHVLYCYFVIYGEMPDQVADPITAAAFWCAQGSIFQRL